MFLWGLMGSVGRQKEAEKLLEFALCYPASHLPARRGCWSGSSGAGVGTLILAGGKREDCRPRGRRRLPGGRTAERSRLGPMSGGLMWPEASLLCGDGRASPGFGQGSQNLLFRLESGGLQLCCFLFV